MKMLVTLDGSHFSEAILATVAKLVGPTRVEVELLTVGQEDRTHQTPRKYDMREAIPAAAPNGTRFNVPLLGEMIPAPAETREQAMARVEGELRDYLAGCARELRELTGIDAEIRVDIGSDPASVIVEHARREKVDLIAMATHGRSGLGHLLAGSVCEQVIRSGVAPVLVLRP